MRLGSVRHSPRADEDAEGRAFAGEASGSRQTPDKTRTAAINGRIWLLSSALLFSKSNPAACSFPPALLRSGSVIYLRSRPPSWSDGHSPLSLDSKRGLSPDIDEHVTSLIMCPFPMELGSGEELRIEFLKIFAEGSYQGSEKMDGIQEHITRDEASSRRKCSCADARCLVGRPRNERANFIVMTTSKAEAAERFLAELGMTMKNQAAKSAIAADALQKFGRRN